MKANLDDRRLVKRPFSSGKLLVGFGFCFFAFVMNASGGVILDAELRLTYEDNVVGLLSDQKQGKSAGGGLPSGMAAPQTLTMIGGMNRYSGNGSGPSPSPGDFSATLSAEAGGFRDVGDDSKVFMKGFAERTSYSTYNGLDATIGGVSAGAGTRFSDTGSVRVAVLGKIKRFGDSQRNSEAFGGNLGVKERITPSLWVRAFGEYERNIADTAAFTYSGATIGAGAGYALLPKTLVTAGYGYLVQKYDEPSGAEMKTGTASFSVERELRRNWTMAGEYDLQISSENTTGSNIVDDIVSVSLRYGY